MKMELWFQWCYGNFSYWRICELFMNYENWSIMIKSLWIGKIALLLLLSIELIVELALLALCGMVHLWLQCLISCQFLYVLIMSLKASYKLWSVVMMIIQCEAICLVFLYSSWSSVDWWCYDNWMRLLGLDVVYMFNNDELILMNDPLPMYLYMNVSS